MHRLLLTVNHMINAGILVCWTCSWYLGSHLLILLVAIEHPILYLCLHKDLSLLFTTPAPPDGPATKTHHKISNLVMLKVKHKVWIAVYSESEVLLLKENFSVFVILSNHLVWQLDLQEAVLDHLLPTKPSRFLCNQIPTY